MCPQESPSADDLKTILEASWFLDWLLQRQAKYTVLYIYLFASLYIYTIRFYINSGLQKV